MPIPTVKGIHKGRVGGGWRGPLWLLLSLLPPLLVMVGCTGSDFITMPPSLKPITAAKAPQVTEIATLEFGAIWIYCLAWSPDGNYLAVGAEPGEVSLWDFTQTMETYRFENPDARTLPTETLVFHPDGTLLLGSGIRGEVTVWDVPTSVALLDLGDRTVWVHEIALSPDGRTVLTGSSPNYGTSRVTLRLWDLKTGDALINFDYTDPVFSVAFSPDGKWIASGSAKGSVRLWDAQTGDWMGTLEGHKAHVLALAFSPDGTLLASSGREGSVFLWDVTARTQKVVLRTQGERVNGVSFSADGSVLASGSDDGTLQLWDVRTGAELAVFEITAARSRSSNRVTALAFSPEGAMLAAGIADGTVRLFAVPLD